MSNVNSFSRRIIFLACCLMALGIGLGAFGAHGLSQRLTEEQLQTFKTGVFYHMIHSMALLIFAILSILFPTLKWRWPAYFIIAGIFCFSGSLYFLSTSVITGISSQFLGPITPLGGVFFILGWVLLGFETLKKQQGYKFS